MAMDATATRQRSRNRLRIMLPLIAFVVIGAVWSIAWFVIADRAGAEIDRALAREAEKGRMIACDDRTLSGFPFRLELRCSGLSVDVDRGDERWSLAANGFVAVAQVYNPRHVIVEVDGPLKVASPDDPRAIEARFASAQASLVMSTTGPERGSLIVDKLDADVVDGDRREPLVGTAKLEAHARLSEGERAAPGRYDVVAVLDAASLPPVDDRLGPAPARIEVQGVVDGLTDWSPRPMRERLRAWQEAGGSVELVLAKIDRGETSAKATGDVALDPEGRPQGKVFVTLAGMEALGEQLKQAGLVPPNVSNMLGVGLSILGKPSNIDGKAAVEVPLILKDGRASVGAFPVGVLAPLY